MGNGKFLIVGGILSALGLAIYAIHKAGKAEEKATEYKQQHLPLELTQRLHTFQVGEVMQRVARMEGYLTPPTAQPPTEP